MNKLNYKNYVSFIIVGIVIILGGYLLVKNKSIVDVEKISQESNQESVEIKDQASIPETTDIAPAVKDEPASDTDSNTLSKDQEVLLKKLKESADKRDFENFSLSLGEVYKNQWGGLKEFTKIESELYVYVYDTYLQKMDLENSLKISTIVYNKVPEAWRFRYVRVLTLEKYGRNAFNMGDLKTAENYASQILQMMYRTEGANLLADVYILKIKTNIKDGNTELAKNNLGYIWDYEVSPDRRVTLEDLKKQLGL